MPPLTIPLLLNGCLAECGNLEEFVGVGRLAGHSATWLLVLFQCYLEK